MSTVSNNANINDYNTIDAGRNQGVDADNGRPLSTVASGALGFMPKSALPPIHSAYTTIATAVKTEVFALPNGQSFPMTPSILPAPLTSSDIVKDNDKLMQLKLAIPKMREDLIVANLRKEPFERLTIDIPAGLYDGSLSGAQALAEIAAMLPDPALQPYLATAEQDLARVDTAVQNGSLTAAQGAAQITQVFDQLGAGIGKINDQQLATMLQEQYKAGDIDAQAVKTALTTHVQQVAAAAKEKAPTLSLDEQVSKLQKDLAAIRAGGVFDIGALILEIMRQANEIRKLANEVRVRENQAALTLQLASAQDTRDRGKEQMIAAVISGVFSIAAGAVSIGGSLTAFAGAKNASDTAKDSITEAARANQKSITDDQFLKGMNDEAGRAFDSHLGVANGVTSGLSQALKGSGDTGSGIQGINVANKEAEGKEHDAYAQAAANRAQTAAKMADDLLQMVMKMVENFIQLNSIRNAGASSIIQKI